MKSHITHMFYPRLQRYIHMIESSVGWSTDHQVLDSPEIQDESNEMKLTLLVIMSAKEILYDGDAVEPYWPIIDMAKVKPMSLGDVLSKYASTTEFLVKESIVQDDIEKGNYGEIKYN